MKTFRPLFIIAFTLVIFSLSGCTVLNRAMYNHIRANVNTALFSTTAVEGTSVAGKITIAGSTTTGSQAMTIIVPASIQPGTYKLASTGIYMIQYKAGNNTVYSASTGELVIISHDLKLKKINGTFSFKGLDLKSASVDVTNGNFTVSYF